MSNPIEQPDVTQDGHGRGTRETHPAFGAVVVTRSGGSNRPLFQSDLKHNSTIRLSVHRAERNRDLNRDWVHPTKQLVEVEMSLAQWGQLVSSVGLGSGVPVTIRHTEKDGQAPDLPYQPRIKRNLTEVDGAVSEMLAGIRDAYEGVVNAVDEKSGMKVLRERLRTLGITLANAPSNAKYAVSSLAEAAEDVTAQARADIEAQILAAVAATGGRASIEGVSIGVIESGAE